MWLLIPGDDVWKQTAPPFNVPGHQQFVDDFLYVNLGNGWHVLFFILPLPKKKIEWQAGALQYRQLVA